MSAPDLVSDCSRCAALCCMVFEFEPGPDFAIDKPGGQGCPHLTQDFGCKIHASRDDRGFGGCVRFDCLGAGQRVTQELFAGRDWRRDPKIVPDMIEAFRKLRQVHKHLELLQLARRLPLSSQQMRALSDLNKRLSADWTETSLQELDEGALSKDVQGFLTSLQDIAEVSRNNT